MKTRITWGILTGLAILLSGCNPQATREGETSLPRVVSSSTIIADFAEDVGGDRIKHMGILQPGADPHVYEPVPEDSIALEKADLIFYNGYNLEPGLIKLMQTAGSNAKQVAVGEVVKPLDFEYQGQKQPDPHVWGDVQNAIAMVEVIRDSLIELSPEHQEIFTQNAAIEIEKLQQLDAWVKEQTNTIPADRRQLITTHDAFQYYAHAYGLKVAGTLIGISTEEQPSAQTVQKLVEEIKATKVPAIFAETTINPQLIKTVAEEAKIQLAETELYSDSIGAPGSEGDSYIKMIVSNTKAIVEALGGKVSDFSEKTGR